MTVWLVEAPAMQGNGMMCSCLECKFEIKKKKSMFVYLQTEHMMLPVLSLLPTSHNFFSMP